MISHVRECRVEELHARIYSRTTLQFVNEVLAAIQLKKKGENKI